MNFVIAVVQAVLLLLLAPLGSGIARVIRAKIHSRKGPSVMQDYYDIAKLFKRQDVRNENTSFVFKLMPPLYLGCMFLLAMGLPMSTAASPLFFMGDLITIIYLLSLPRFFFSLAGIDSSNAYGGYGSIRELLIGVLIEPTIILSLLVAALATGTMNIGSMGGAVIAGNVSAPVAMFFAGVACAVACYVEMGKLPFDLAEAEQEIQEGPLQEYSGPSLAMAKVALSMKQLVMIGIFVAVFIPFGAATQMTVGAIALGGVIYALKVLVLALIADVIENTVSRVRYIYLSRQTWALFGVAVLAFAFLAMGV